MQFIVSAVVGIVGLYALAVGAWHLAYGQWFPYFPAPVAEIYNALQMKLGASFRFMAIVLLICGGLVFFFAFLLYPRHK
ncbi:MAG: hypothetical protein KIT18_09875 [Burkholderiales bacterium]|nr:hypothetical protein [Burkholderiales bacterium]